MVSNSLLNSIVGFCGGAAAGAVVGAATIPYESTPFDNISDATHTYRDSSLSIS